MEQQFDRHLECSSCKKPITCHYTEVLGKTIYKLGMCQDCPFLQKKLHGTLASQVEQQTAYQPGGLTCGGCGLTADEVRMGSSLGCSLCYEVFEDILLRELSQANRIVLKQGSKIQHLHIGRRPGQPGETNPASKLLALHQALNDTLQHEDYEQAAWLRDQIKALTNEKNVDEQT